MMKSDVLMYEPKVAYRNKRLLYFGCRLVWALLFPQQNIFVRSSPVLRLPKNSRRNSLLLPRAPRTPVSGVTGVLTSQR